jgi:N utilization substance protein A
VKLSHVIDELTEERGLDRNLLAAIMCEGLLAAYKKKYPDAQLEVLYNRKSDELSVVAQKTVVQAVSDDEREISLRKARGMQEGAQLGDVLPVPFEGIIGRVEILRAKQLIAQRIRAVEAEAVYNEFKDQEGTIVRGVIHKCERNGAVVKLGEHLAFMPKSLMNPADQCIAGYSIRALLKEVLVEPRGDSQLILDRSSPEFLKQLLELEIPEIFEGLVEVKKVARIAGYKSKVIVASHDRNVDPVGTCIGVGGSRIKPVLREIGGEKIDIIRLATSVEELVKAALKPAEVERVQLVDGQAHVFVSDEQRPIAIGKQGQNIALASRLVGMPIVIAQPNGQGAAGGDHAFGELDEEYDRFNNEE